jgi:hypothetical protein
MHHAISYTNYSTKGRRIPMTVNRVASCGVSVLLLLSAYSPCAAQSIERYLHKNASLGEGPSPELLRQSEHNPISPRQAASFAVRHLKAKGVTDIKICEVNWIAAPLGGYLVDAKGNATIKGKHYSLFRVGVRDGTDEKAGKLLGGELFVFIALGKDRKGRQHWYPSPGPDYSLRQGEDVTEGMLAYEFLLDRDRFETLGRRYP